MNKEMVTTLLHRMHKNACLELKKTPNSEINKLQFHRGKLQAISQMIKAIERIPEDDYTE